MREEDRNDIRNLPLFRNMTSPAFDALMHAAYDQVFPAQLELIRQGEVANFLHVVLEGAVELYANWQDRDTTMAVVQPVATFILAACMRDAPYLMSARTLRRSRIVLIPAVDVRAAFARDHGFALATVQELSEAIATSSAMPRTSSCATPAKGWAPICGKDRSIPAARRASCCRRKSGCWPRIWG